MSQYLTDEEVNELLMKIQDGDNAAWGQLCDNFEQYIHHCAWKKIRTLDMTDAKRKDIEEDLYMAGWTGFVSAIKRYDYTKGKLLTYATHDIKGEISKELDLILNPLGLVEKSKSTKGKNRVRGISTVSLDDSPEYISSRLENTVPKNGKEICLENIPNGKKYSAERRVLQILEVLRLNTDENHCLSKDEIGNLLSIYRIAKHKNGTPLEAPNTIASTLEHMLAELNPMEYSDENEAAYKVRYEGYKENRLKQKLHKKDKKKSSDITGFSYVHLFNNEQLDKLIQLISFSDMLSVEEKSQLICKLTETASVYYKSPFWDGEKLKFNPRGVHSRFSGRIIKDKMQFAENVKLIQQAINNLGQIRFKFNCYTEEHTMIPKTEHWHTLSPYHLVVYHDNFYCIGKKINDDRIWHYRVDLMSEVEIVRDDKGRTVPISILVMLEKDVKRFFVIQRSSMSQIKD